MRRAGENLLLSLLPLLPALCTAPLLGQHSLLLSQVLLIALLGFFLSDRLVSSVGEYTKAAGLFGKDLGKKGTPQEDKEIPEALGIVPGTVFLICTIFSQLAFAHNFEQLKWRYKLILPTIASLPLLVAYSGPTAVIVPKPFQYLLMEGNNLTALGRALDLVVTVDTNAQGSIIELGYFFLFYMGLLAVFCTNAINIYAGINGLECGQAYIIGCSILFFKLYELSHNVSEMGDDMLFSLSLVIPFIFTSLGLLRHNWFPANVFVGDTYCYFAGMTFAVIGIHGHFSKTLLLLFIPQVVNFLYSIPQLFKILPCPRHRLPRVQPATGLMYHSSFPCESSRYRWLKVKPNDTECPNLTLVCLVLRITGPLTERSLCVLLLGLQVLTSCVAFVIRYYVLHH